MAKKKSRKSMLPKRIGGVKVPKTLRKGRAGRFLTSPAGVALIADAVVAGGALLTAKSAAKPGTKANRLAHQAHAEFDHLAETARTQGGHSADALKGAFAAAAAAFAEALRTSADAIEPASKKSNARPDLATARAAH